MAANRQLTQERTLVWIAAVAYGVGMLALGETIFAGSWLYGVVAFSVAVLSFAVGSVAMQWPRIRRPAAPTNTKLQQPPPAIIESDTANREPSS